MTDEIHTLNPGDTLSLEYPTLTIHRFTPPPPPQGFVFAFLTDTHHRRNGVDMRPHIEHVLAQGQALTFLTGDITENGTQEQFEELADLLLDVLCVPGNHDERKLHSDPGPNDYTYYKSHGPNSFRFAIMHEGHKFIGFTAQLNRDVYKGFAHVTEVDGISDRQFVEDEIASAPDGTVIWLLLHFPAIDALGENVNNWWDFDGGQEWLFDLCNQHNVKAVLYGHRHVGFRVDTDPAAPNTKFVHGGCLGYDINFPDGHFQLIEVTADGSVTINVYRGRSPYELLQTVEL